MGKASHKAFDVNENIIMRTYYQKDVLTFMCCANEMFYISLYLLNFSYGPISKFELRYFSFNVISFRSIGNVFV